MNPFVNRSDERKGGAFRMNPPWRIAKLSAFVPLCLLSSCVSLYAPNRQTSIIVPGYFYATPHQEDAPFDYDLEVKEIGKGEFDSANGINTVQDGLTGRYYALTMKKIHRKTGEQFNFDFENLYDRSPNATHLAIRYTDDNGFRLTPMEDSKEGRYSTFYAETKEVYDDLSYGLVMMEFIPKWDPIPPAEAWM